MKSQLKQALLFFLFICQGALSVFMLWHESYITAGFFGLLAFWCYFCWRRYKSSINQVNRMFDFDRTTKRMVKDAFRHGLEKDYVSEAKLWSEIANRLDERNESNYMVIFLLGRAMQKMYENKLYEDYSDGERLLRVSRKIMNDSRKGYELLKLGFQPYDKTWSGLDIERIFSEVEEDYQNWLDSDRMT